MKTKAIQSFIKTASVAVIAVTGAFLAIHVAKANDTVYFHQDANKNITCYTTNHSQTGPTCADEVYNAGDPNGETLSWTSISIQPVSPAWLTASPQQSAAPLTGCGNPIPASPPAGCHTTVTYTVPSNLGAGTYNATVTFNGQSDAPGGSISVPADTVTVQFIVDASGSVGAPTNPTNTNTNGNGAVACNTIRLNWTAGSNAQSYDIFRNGVQITSHTVGTTYTDSAVTAGVSYSYTIRSYNATFGNSATVAFSPASIQASACLVDLSLSDDLISQVNTQPYPYNSGCIGSQSGTAVVIHQWDAVELRVNVCNRGTAAAQNVMLSSAFNNTTFNTSYSCCWSNGTTPTSFSNGSSNGITVNWSLGTINPNSNSGVNIFFYPNHAGGNTTQNLLRFINSATITYTSTGGHVAPAGCVGNYADVSSPCVVSTGYVPFSTAGNQSASQQEIKP